MRWTAWQPARAGELHRGAALCFAMPCYAVLVSCTLCSTPGRLMHACHRQLDGTGHCCAAALCRGHPCLLQLAPPQLLPLQLAAPCAATALSPCSAPGPLARPKSLLPSALPLPTCRSVVLAAAPATLRWSPTRHAFFPPAFKRATRQLLLANHRLLKQACAPAAEAPPAGGQQEAVQGKAAGAVGSPGTPPSSSAGGSNAAGGSNSAPGAAGGAAPPPVAPPPRGLPHDALCEVLRHLASAPLSFWLRHALLKEPPPASRPTAPTPPSYAYTAALPPAEPADAAAPQQGEGAGTSQAPPAAPAPAPADT